MRLIRSGLLVALVLAFAHPAFPACGSDPGDAAAVLLLALSTVSQWSGRRASCRRLPVRDSAPDEDTGPVVLPAHPTTLCPEEPPLGHVTVHGLTSPPPSVLGVIDAMDASSAMAQSCREIALRSQAAGTVYPIVPAKILKRAT